MLKTKVTCWFCNKTSQVFILNRNSWTCQHCEQYNGFNKVILIKKCYIVSFPSLYIPYDVKLRTVITIKSFRRCRLKCKIKSTAKLATLMAAAVKMDIAIRIRSYVTDVIRIRNSNWPR